MARTVLTAVGRLPRPVLLAGLCVLLAGAASCRRTSPLGEPRLDTGDVRQVVLITIDALRIDAVGPGEAGESITPVIDALADSSLVFSQARTPAPWTLASFGSMMTGFPVSVHRARKFKSKVPEQLPTLAEHMSGAGFRTAGAGVNVYLKPETGLSRGFDEYYFFVHEWFKGRKKKPPLQDWLEPEYRKKQWYNGTPVLTEFALRWLEKNRDRDFFLWLHYLDPHIPYFPPPSYRPGGKVPEKVDRALHSRKQGFKVKRPAQRKLVRKYYQGEVCWVDGEVGRIIDKLESLGIYDDALVILTSDHGEEFWDHGGVDHGHTLYDELLHVPLIVKLPLTQDGSPHHAVIDEYVTTQGLMPLILDACGVDGYDASLDAMSLAPQAGIVAGGGGPPTALFASGLVYGKDREAVIFDGWKYIRVIETGKDELYDLRADPDEKKNIAKMMPDIVLRARKLLAAHESASQAVQARYGIHDAEQITFDEKTLEQLRAIGYVF